VSAFVAPPGACDAHTHVFGPPGLFPQRIETSYPLPIAPAEDHRAMLAAAGLSRGVIVQPAAYGTDHAAMIDALAEGGGAMVGVGSLAPGASEAEFDRLDAAGVRSLRFVEALDPAGKRYRGTVGFAALDALAPAMRAHGWHAELWAPAERIVADSRWLAGLGVPVVLGHLGGMLAADGLNSTGNATLIDCIADCGFWTKLTLCRASQRWPDYDDAKPLHDALVRRAARRLVWGSDWPHIRLGERTPRVTDLLTLLHDWLDRDESLTRAILVDNPARLYGFAATD